MAIIAAGQQACFNATQDYNGADPEGFGLIQETIRRGRRWSAATAYLRPALRRKNLRVIVEAQAGRILMDGTRASGVAFRHNGEAKGVTARREVIVCAGTINTPKLLMLSGIGDPGHLQAHGIDTVVAAPGVGRDLRTTCRCC